MRFVRGITLLVLLLIALLWIFSQTDGWHRATVTDQARSGGVLARQLRETPIPDDPLAIYYCVDALRSLGLQEDAQMLSHYVARQLLLSALGEPLERVATVAAALHKEKEGGKSLDALRERVLGSSFQVSLQPLREIAPTAKSRDAPLASDDKPPRELSVVLANRLHAAITHYDLYISIDKAESVTDKSMVEFRLRCVNDYMSTVPQDQKVVTNCAMDLSGRTVQAADLASTIDKVRAGALALAVSPARVFIKINSPEVSAMLVSKGDVSFSGRSWENSKGSVIVRQSSCEQRGDCEAVMKRKVSEYTGYLQYGILVTAGMIFGFLSRGIISLITRPGWMRNGLSVAVLGLSLGLVPFAWSYGGWVPLVAVIFAGLFLIGLVVGFAIAPVDQLVVAGGLADEAGPGT